MCSVFKLLAACEQIGIFYHPPRTYWAVAFSQIDRWLYSCPIIRGQLTIKPIKQFTQDIFPFLPSIKILLKQHWSKYKMNQRIRSNHIAFTVRYGTSIIDYCRQHQIHAKSALKRVGTSVNSSLQNSKFFMCGNVSTRVSTMQNVW